MEKDWMLIFTTENAIEADMMKHLMEEEQIQSVVINKTGQPYTQLGFIELYVHWQQAERALQIIEQTQ